MNIATILNLVHSAYCYVTEGAAYEEKDMNHVHCFEAPKTAMHGHCNL
jgi:hypothetical protein